MRGLFDNFVIARNKVTKQSPGRMPASGDCRAALAMTWLLFVFLLAGCSGEDATGPGEVRWDRESCNHCAMAISDRHFAAQVRGGAAGQKTRLYKFDDIGCAVVWLDGQSWKDDARTEIWVTDQLSGEWIDARHASYITGKVTPMDYGLGAQREALPGSLDFTRARQHIYAEDERKQLHGGAHQHDSSLRGTK